AWVRLSWVRGLQRLGFRVYFLEQIGRAACLDDSGIACPFANCVNRAYFQEVTGQFGLSGSAALIYEDGEEIHGLEYGEVLEIAQESDLLVNISGHLTHEPLLRRFRRKAYIDLDPGFTQFWHAAGNAEARLVGH